MSNVLAAVFLHLAFQLVIAEHQSLENVTTHTPLPQPQPEPVLPEGYTAFPDMGVAWNYRANRFTPITVRPTPARRINLPGGYVGFPDDHVAYKVYKEAVLWDDARDLCIEEGAHLAIADTVEKITHIHSTLPQVDWWINVGIRRGNTRDEWVRIDNGLSLTSLPWQEYFPADHGNCTGISSSGNVIGNYDCDLWRNWYVCEIPIYEDRAGER